MPRRRFGVVLLVPEPWASEIQGLRRGLGDTSRERVAPHITLVPPVNVHVDQVAEVLRILRSAGISRRDEPLVLELGPARSFVPASETAFLAVGGDEHARTGLDALRTAVFTGPLERTLEFPFVAHVTIADGVERPRIAAAVEALQEYVVTASFDRVHLLEEQRIDGMRRWVPIADAPFAAPGVVGRGGVELELTTSELVDPEGLVLVDAALAPDREGPDRESQDDDEVLDGDATLPAGAAPVVITARRAGTVVAVGRGWRHPHLHGEVTLVAVAPDHHDQGIGAQVAAALASATS
jgi:2'-5' RNA ligase